MQSDDVILGTPEHCEEIAGKTVRIRQMAAGPSTRFAIDVAKFQIEISKYQPVMKRISDVLSSPTEEGLNELVGLAQKADEFDRKKIPIVKKIIGEEYEDQWIVDNVTLSPLLGLIDKQVELNSLGLRRKNPTSPLPRAQNA